jgi:hypothetical protein
VQAVGGAVYQQPLMIDTWNAEHAKALERPIVLLVTVSECLLLFPEKI